MSIHHELGKQFLSYETDMPDLLGKIEDVNKWYQIINLKMDEEIVSYKEKMDQKIADALNDQMSRWAARCCVVLIGLW